MLIADLFILAKNLEATTMFFSRRKDKLVDPYNRLLFSTKKK